MVTLNCTAHFKQKQLLPIEILTWCLGESEQVLHLPRVALQLSGWTLSGPASFGSRRTLPFIQPFKAPHWNPRPLSLEESPPIHSIIYGHPKMSYSRGYRTLNGGFMIAWAASLLKMIKPYCLIWELAKSFQAKKKKKRNVMPAWQQKPLENNI